MYLECDHDFTDQDGYIGCGIVELPFICMCCTFATVILMVLSWFTSLRLQLLTIWFYNVGQFGGWYDFKGFVGTKICFWSITEMVIYHCWRQCPCWNNFQKELSLRKLTFLRAKKQRFHLQREMHVLWRSRLLLLLLLLLPQNGQGMDGCKGFIDRWIWLWGEMLKVRGHLQIKVLMMTMAMLAMMICRTIISQTSNSCNLGSWIAREEPKKRKIKTQFPRWWAP